MPLWIALPILVMMMVSVGTIMLILRLSSKSVWPAVLFHACQNFIGQGLLYPSTTGSLAPYLVGDNGLFTAIAMVLCMVVFWMMIGRKWNWNLS